MEQAWDITRGDGVVIAVVDSGVDYNHPELASRMWTNPDEIGEAPDNGFPGDIHGWDFAGSDNDPMDDHGHGTMLAGIIAAQDNNATGIVGVAPASQIMAVRVLDHQGIGRSSQLAAGIIYAADNDAEVILVSSGCGARCPSDPLVENAMRWASGKGAVVVISAGNRGDDLRFYSPQNLIDHRPIVVGSTDQLDRRESFSSFGEFLDIVAPGGGTNVAPPAVEPVLNILSLAPNLCSLSVCRPDFLVGGGTQYVRRGGTSMSAAYVAGVAALVLANENEPGIDVVRKRLFGNAVDLGPKGHDPMFGWGRVRGLYSVADMRSYLLSRILAPVSGETVSGTIRIVGSADGRESAVFEISVGAGASPATWQIAGIRKVDRATPQGDLALWDTRGYAPGLWTIRLVVRGPFSSLPTREFRRTITVVSTTEPSPLVVHVASERLGTGSIHVDPPRAFCDAFPGTTQACSYPAAAAGTVTLTAFPGEGSNFSGWGGAPCGGHTCTVDLATSRAIRAEFFGSAPLTVAVSRSAGADGHVIVDPPMRTCAVRCRITYPRRTDVELLPVPAMPADQFRWRFGFGCFGSGSCTTAGSGLVRGEFFRPAPPSSVQIGTQGSPSRVRLGIPVQLFLSYSGVPPLTFTWVDTTAGRLLSTQDHLDVLLGLGLHDIVVTMTDATGASGSDSRRVIVIEP